LDLGRGYGGSVEESGGVDEGGEGGFVDVVMRELGVGEGGLFLSGEVRTSFYFLRMLDLGALDFRIFRDAVIRKRNFIFQVLMISFCKGRGVSYSLNENIYSGLE